ncbi:MAG: aminopeptidase [Bacilli bacterium]
MEKIKEYAKLIVEVGLNVKEGENVIITSQISTPELVYHVMEESYAAGAREVVVRWIDDTVSRKKFLNDKDEVFDNIPQWNVEYFNHYDAMNSNYLNIYSSDPEALKGVDNSRIMKMSKLTNEALSEHVGAVMGNAQSWCVVSVPNKAWAKKVFPDLSEEVAVSKLWDLIFDIVRVGDSKASFRWEKHLENMARVNKEMNSQTFEKLHFSSESGTDLYVGLVKNHIWCGGSEKNITTGKYFVANMPTEESFTMPNAMDVNGVVYNTKPLSYNGSLIDNFKLVFKDGKVVDFSAEVGEDVLASMLATDEGASRLGEVALVSNDSPISQSNVLFYNTLFDENASCHLALGRAYPINIADYEQLSDSDKQEIGINTSAIHVDFMIGDSTTRVVGIKGNSEVVVFDNGSFVL